MVLWLILTHAAIADDYRVTFHTRPEGAKLELVADEDIYLGLTGHETDVPVRGAKTYRFRLSLDGYAPATLEVSADDLQQGRVPATSLTPNRWDTRLKPWWVVLPIAALVGVPLLASRRRRQRLGELLAKRPDPLVGETLDGWLLTERLGEGGMGAVFKAVNAETLNEAEAVAIKIVRLDGAVARGRFEREIRIGITLQHPNLARIIDWGDSYIVMELIAGETLRARMPMPVEQAVAIIRPVMAAVAYAHEHGVVHRDLKPDNIMITPAGKPVVMDFGIAHSVHHATVTPTHHVSGTLAYMAPEQATGDTTDHRVDQFALGIIFHEMLTGYRPHEHARTLDANEMLLHKLKAVPPLPDGFPPAVAAVVARLLAENPKDRFPSVADALQALQ